MKLLLLICLCALGSLVQPAAAQEPSAIDDELLQGPALQPWTGDLDGMIERRIVRVLVAPSRSAYWLNGARQSGAEYELIKALEAELNKRHSQGKHIKIFVAPIATRHDQLISGLLEGRGDIAAGLLTLTPERLEQVDFGEPFFKGAKQIVVTGPASPQLKSLDDLSNREVFVRRSSSAWTHLEHLSERLRSEGKAPVVLKAAPEDLLDDDLLEMVHAGLVSLTVVNRYQALLWAQVYKKLKPRPDLVVHKEGSIGWMIRKNSPQLQKEIAAFAQGHGQNTAFGKALVRKYASSPRILKEATSPGEIKKFDALAEYFRRYSANYSTDHLLMIAQGYQESLLNQNARSGVGAIGVMQLMPATGREMKTGDIGDITELEPNIHAGIKYVSLMRNEFFADQPMDDRNKILFSFAAYNAGPGRVLKLQKEAHQRGLDPYVHRRGNRDLCVQHLQILCRV